MWTTMCPSCGATCRPVGDSAITQPYDAEIFCMGDKRQRFDRSVLTRPGTDVQICGLQNLPEQANLN